MSRPVHGSAHPAPARRAAPDYTAAVLVMAGVNLLWIFFALWAAWGFGAVVAAGYALHVAIEALRRHRARRA
ncbi:hypothetical protein [Pseudooceanicola marinus]|nr:hypothetical protein [Pseudooceanicola marinus]MBY5972006.1 hypothetical protein [Ferrimonas balearica]MCA1335110.1 hypothetical protein [Pseudooceanicola marinus]